MSTIRGWIAAITLTSVAALGLAAVPDGNNHPENEPALLNESALANRIDQFVESQYVAKDIKPATVADDAEFLRRVYLDLTGRIPRVSEVRTFLAGKSPHRRAELVETLLDSPRYVLHMGNTLRQLLVPPGSNQQFAFFQPNFKAWIDKQVQENVPYDKMVRELLTVPIAAGNPQFGGRIILNGGGGGGNAPSPVAYYQANEFKAENLASNTSRIFLGVRLECAQCHNHPFAKWTRQQFWEYAAFFSGLQPGQPNAGLPVPTGQPVQPNKTRVGREIKISGTDKLVSARFLDGNAPQWKDNTTGREALADWFVSPENPYFAKTAVNRIWAHFFGIGIVDPVEDEPTEENPASHPELLKELTEQFIAHKFDVKYLIRAITTSKTYQRSSVLSHPSQNEPRLFARMALKGMTPAQLFDSLAMATGYQESAGGNPRFQAFGGPNSPRTEFLNLFASQDKKTATQTSILQALALINGKFIADATSLEKSRTLAAVIDLPASNAQRIETLYLSTVGRFPREEEASRLLEYVNNGGATNDERAALADVFWVLLNSSEFAFNH